MPRLDRYPGIDLHVQLDVVLKARLARIALFNALHAVDLSRSRFDTDHATRFRRAGPFAKSRRNGRFARVDPSHFEVVSRYWRTDSAMTGLNSPLRIAIPYQDHRQSQSSAFEGFCLIQTVLSFCAVLNR